MKMHSIEGFVLGQEHFQFWACDSEAGATWSFTIFFFSFISLLSLVGNLSRFTCEKCNNIRATSKVFKLTNNKQTYWILKR